jgi:hypothetical protein
MYAAQPNSTHDCVLKLLKFSSNANECKPLLGMKRLKLSHDDMLSSFAVNVILRHYTTASMLINVVTGRSQQLGLPSPCLTAVDTSSYIVCSIHSSCTCNRYLAGRCTLKPVFASTE